MLRHVPDSGKVDNGGQVYNHPAFRCPTCSKPFRFTSSLTAHLMTAHGMTGWTAIRVTIVVREKGGRHV
jgi:uncharacterized C2H2 Zn-finger protein